MKFPSVSFSVEERIAMGARCRDCDPVPKVAEAGMVFEDPTGRRIQIMHNGLRVLADGYYGAWMTDLIRICRGHHEAQEERLFHEVVRRLPSDATMIELGGYWAYYSLWFLKDQPGRRAVVVEPEPDHLEVGRVNAALNALAPEFLHGLVGRRSAPEVPFRGERSGDMILQCHSVEQLMVRQDWDKLSLLHCDIQGAEFEVLDSCRPLLQARRIDWVFVSTHAQAISGDPLIHQRCLQLLRDCGAIIEAEHDVHESFSGDGLIVARFCPTPPDWEPVTPSYNRHSRSLFRALAYDLDECLRQKAALLTEQATGQTAPLHPSLRRSGTLFMLNSDGALGQSGDTLLLPDDHVMGPSVMRDGAWDYHNIEQFAAHLHPDRDYTLIDIGANVGLFSRQLALVAPRLARIICVEPDRYNFQALRYNMQFLQDRVQFHNVALGDADGERELFRDMENIGNYSLNPDAMRSRSFESVSVALRETRAWMGENLAVDGPLLWKSDTQGFDEVIVAGTPLAVWQRIEVALIEIWRIAKPEFDRQAFRLRLEAFPHRRLGDEAGVSVDAVLDYLSGNDWQFQELLLWK